MWSLHDSVSGHTLAVPKSNSLLKLAMHDRHKHVSCTLQFMMFAQRQGKNKAKGEGGHCLGKSFFLQCQKRHPELPNIPTYLPWVWTCTKFVHSARTACNMLPLSQGPKPLNFPTVHAQRCSTQRKSKCWLYPSSCEPMPMFEHSIWQQIEDKAQQIH